MTKVSKDFLLEILHTLHFINGETKREMNIYYRPCFGNLLLAQLLSNLPPIKKKLQFTHLLYGGECFTGN